MVVLRLNNHINRNTKIQFILGKDRGQENTLTLNQTNDIFQAHSSVVELTIRIFE